MKANWKWSNLEDDKSEREHSRNQRTNMDWMGEFNSDAIISTTVGRNPSEEME